MKENIFHFKSFLIDLAALDLESKSNSYYIYLNLSKIFFWINCLFRFEVYSLDLADLNYDNNSLDICKHSELIILIWIFFRIID